MKFYPISELTRSHMGKVVLACVNELHTGKTFGRPWEADEGPEGPGTDQIEDLVACGFTHFLLLSEIEAEDRLAMERRWGPLTQAEETLLAERYQSPERRGEQR